MIKLNEREMKNLSRILTVLLCFAPVAYASGAPVATTAGSNLTAFNPSNANNNQWATMSNGRYDSANAPTAKADFGNCNALILRCAQPKCSNGGCSEASIASAIVKGCVQSNSNCKQYGDDLVQYMTAQLVASSNAKINEQQAAAANAAAEAAQQQSQQQMQQMQYQMQQMQQQMAQQQAESAQQLQEALAQQAAQNAAALESMKSAATDAAKENEAGVSAYQQEAIDRGISADVIERQKITGQIMTEIENAEVSLKEVKVAMNNAFEYAKCDARGNNCSGPKRVKKWRELATEFLAPYDNTIDKIYDALIIAQTVGVDLSQIYMMLNNSCNSWGQYLCPQMTGGKIVYTDPDSTSKGVPLVCPKGATSGYVDVDVAEVRKCVAENVDVKKTSKEELENIERTCNAKYTSYRTSANSGCQPCTMIKVLTESKDDQDAVYEGWVNAEKGTSDGNTTVVACASGALNSSKLFARRTKTKNGAGLVDIDKLDTWLHQVGIDKTYKNLSVRPTDYCGVLSSLKDALTRAALGKNIVKDQVLCVSDVGATGPKEDENCPYINPIYAICDTHQYNANVPAGQKLDSDKIAEMKEIIGLKTTVISQQMYKQYEYLNATLRRLKTQLEKATLTAKLEAAGAKTEDGSSSGGLLGGKSDSDKEIVLAGAENCWNAGSSSAAYTCIQNNLNLIKSNASTNKKKAAQQLNKTVVVAGQWGIYAQKKTVILGKDKKEVSDCDVFESGSPSDKDKITTCANALSIAVARKIDDEKKEANRYSRDRY